MVLTIAAVLLAGIHFVPSEEFPDFRFPRVPSSGAAEFAPAVLGAPAAPASGALDRIRPGERNPGPASRAFRTVLRRACLSTVRPLRARANGARGLHHAIRDSGGLRAAREARGVHAARDDIPLAGA